MNNKLQVSGTVSKYCARTWHHAAHNKQRDWSIWAVLSSRLVSHHLSTPLGKLCWEALLNDVVQSHCDGYLTPHM